MQPIPQPVTDVTIYPYIPDAPIEVPPALVNGVGTYAVGTLTTNIFYNLNLSSGTQQNGGVHAGNRYWATYRNADGSQGRTPWMRCLQAGDAPQFGRTISMIHGATPNSAATSDIVFQVHMSDVSVDMFVNPTEPLVVPIIEGGTGIATFAGLLPGGTWSVSVSGGTRVNPLHDGMRVTVRGTNVATGQPFSIPAVLITTNAGDPAIFVQQRLG